MSAHDMTTGGRSPHMPGGVDPEQLVDDGSHERTGGHTADLEERDPLMGEAPMNDSTERSGGVEPPD
jgi:hypothetical protein